MPAPRAVLPPWVASLQLVATLALSLSALSGWPTAHASAAAAARSVAASAAAAAAAAAPAVKGIAAPPPPSFHFAAGRHATAPSRGGARTDAPSLADAVSSRMARVALNMASGAADGAAADGPRSAQAESETHWGLSTDPEDNGWAAGRMLSTAHLAARIALPPTTQGPHVMTLDHADPTLARFRLSDLTGSRPDALSGDQVPSTANTQKIVDTISDAHTPTIGVSAASFKIAADVAADATDGKTPTGTTSTDDEAATAMTMADAAKAADDAGRAAREAAAGADKAVADSEALIAASANIAASNTTTASPPATSATATSATATAATTAMATATTATTAKSTGPVVVTKPQQDDREYRYVELPNKLAVLLISDPEQDKSAAAMDVNVGHLRDPDDFPGLAHFCEHLLFMGTEKYPNENAYMQYLSAHSGYSNAFTAVEHTNYYFEVGSDHLEGALDRFAQFFIAPLFNPDGTDRELHAVDSENKKNLQQDGWRLYQLQKDLSHPDHPFRKFGTGSLVTLKEQPEAKGLDIREALLKFHGEYYSANLMKLTIAGKESLDQLETWAHQMFAAVPNKNAPIPDVPATPHPLTPTELGFAVHVIPVQSIRSVELLFPFPSFADRYHSHPEGYLSHLLGHESEGSILSYLKQKDWALSLSAGNGSGGRNFDFFKITISLTEEGLLHVHDVATIVFQYIAMLRKEGPQQWVHEEVRRLSAMNFRFQEKSRVSNYVSQIAGSMHLFAPQDILSGHYLMEVYDPEAISQGLTALDPANFRMTITAKELLTDGANTADDDAEIDEDDAKAAAAAKKPAHPLTEGHDDIEWKTAQVYGTQYRIIPFSSDFVKKVKKARPIDALHLPKANPFIAENFDIELQRGVPHNKMLLLEDTKLLRTWYWPDVVFKVPKVVIEMRLQVPQLGVSPRQHVEISIWLAMIRDLLSDEAYFAETAGLNYSFQAPDLDRLMIRVTGYNDRATVFLQQLLARIKTATLESESKFDNIREGIKRGLVSAKARMPMNHAQNAMAQLLSERSWTVDECLDVIDTITLQDMHAMPQTMLSQLFIETFVAGNMDAFKAQAVARNAAQVFRATPLSALSRGTRLRTVMPHPTELVLYEQPVPLADENNSAVLTHFVLGDLADDQTRALARLLNQVAVEPCFSTLRTQEQLGYIVGSMLARRTNYIAFGIAVQSERDPMFVQWRISVFLNKLYKTVKAWVAEEDQITLDAQSAGHPVTDPLAVPGVSSAASAAPAHRLAARDVPLPASEAAKPTDADAAKPADAVAAKPAEAEAPPQYADFLRHRSALVSQLREKDKNLAEASGKYSAAITGGTYFFDELEVDATNVNALTARQLMLLMERTLGVGEPKDGTVLYPTQIAVHLRSQKLAEKEESWGPEAQAWIKEFRTGASLVTEDTVGQFRASHFLGPQPRPRVPLSEYDYEPQEGQVPATDASKTKPKL